LVGDSFQPLIMVVDDIQENVDILSLLLKKKSFRVLAASSGNEALGYLEHIHPDLILLDIMMPEMDGFEVLQRIREKPDHPPVIFLSAHSQTGAITRGFELGAVDFISKPFQSAELLARVNTHLKIKEYEKSLQVQNRELQELSQKWKRASEERELYFRAFQHSLHAIVITDSEGKILHVNPAFEKLYGVSPTVAMGNNPRLLNPGKQAYRDAGIEPEEYEDLFRQMWLDIKNPNIGHWQGEVLNQKANGEVIWVDLSINALFDAVGELTHFIGMPMDIHEKKNRERAIRMETYRAITQLAEMRDNETGNHIQRVGKMARLLAEELKLPEHYCRNIEIFSQLHDIGKVGISDTILLKPGPLDEEEWKIMKTHTTYGFEILRDKPSLEMAAEIALSHHEKYDGSGYPQGLKAEEIPMCARITTLVDVYDALRSDRPYKKAWSREAAEEEILAKGTSWFDPQIIRAFLGVRDDFDAISAGWRD